MRFEQERNIDHIRAELQAMTDSCNDQKNVNTTIKDGSKKMRQLVDAIDKDHKSAKAKDDFYRRLQADCEDLRQDRRITRERLQAKVMRNVVPVSNEDSNKALSVNKSKPLRQTLAPKNVREDN